MIAGLRPRRLSAGPADLELDRAQVLRFLGYKPGRTRSSPLADAAVDAGIGAALAVLAPQAALVECAVTAADADRGEVALAAGVTWRSRRLAGAFAGAHAVTLVAATVGPGIDAAVDHLWAQQEYAVATVVDAAGSAAIHAWLTRIRAHVFADGAAAGFTAADPVSPGYGDWDLADQIPILKLTRAAGIGIESNPTCYLQPQKSVVAAIAWLADDDARPLSGCAVCRMPGCAYRQLPARTAAPVH